MAGLTRSRTYRVFTTRSCFCLALLFGASSPHARASAPPASGPAQVQAAAADAFDDGRSAFEAGRYAQAVESFERAQSLAPHPATVYNLALALEQSGESLRAWQLFYELQTSAQSTERREEAAQRRVALEAKVAVLRVIANAGDEVCVDGESWTASTDSAGTRVRAFFPGSHLVGVQGTQTSLDLVAGEQRVLVMNRASTRTQKERRAMLALSAGALTSALAAGGLAAASTQLDTPSSRRALAWGAVGSATLSGALSATVLGLAIKHRRQGGRRNKRSEAPVGAPAPAPCASTRVEPTAPVHKASAAEVRD